MAEFTHVGGKCSMPLCNQRDFLPFDCDCCQKVFCLSHRSYAAHECQLSGSRNMTAIVCPLCKTTLRLNDTQDPNDVWEAHTRSGSCSPEKRQRKAKRRCNAQGCREVLGLTNGHTCTHCHAAVCLSHRFPEAHDCTLRRAAARSSGTRSFFSSAQQPAQQQPRPAQQQAAAARRAAAALQRAGGGPGNSVRDTAARRQQQHQQPQQQQAPAQRGGGEMCPQCGASFGDVVALISHVEGAHSAGAAAAAVLAPEAMGGGACPFCQRAFVDAVELVAHVEREHDGGRGLTATAGGDASGKCVMA